MNKQLNQIRALMQSGDSTQAQQQIKIYLRDNPEDAQGWYLASFLYPTPPTRLEAIQRAARLSPTQADIQKRLAKLQASESPQKRSSWLPLLIIVILIIGVVLVLGFIIGNRPSASVSDLPTLAILPTLSETPTQQIAVNSVVEATTPTTLPPTLQASATETTVLNVDTASATAQPGNPTAVVNPVESTQVFVQPGSPLPLPTAFTAIDNTPQITDAAPTSVSSAPTLAPTIASTLSTLAPTIPPTLPATSIPSATPVYQNVPLNTAINITAGQFRVVDATIGAESAIQDLGGTFAPAPTHQSWVLLELLLVCQNSATCKFDPSVLKIIGASGTAYFASNQLYSIPIFGSLTQDNQIWGYLGFTVPTSETQLRLILASGSQTYAIPLE